MGDVSGEEKKGIIPRALETVFTAVADAQEVDPGLSFTTTVSFICIYLEQVTDLLSKDVHKPLNIKENVSDGVYVKDLTSCTILSPAEGLQALQQGTTHHEEQHVVVYFCMLRSCKVELLTDYCYDCFITGINNRVIAYTRMDQCSSRMHSLFYVNVY